MASTPVWIGTPKVWNARTTGANTSPDGSTTTNLVSLVGTVASGGARIERISVVHAPAGSGTNNTAGVLRIYHKRSSNYRLVKEFNATAAGRSTTAKGFADEWYRSDGQPVLVLEASDEVYVGSELGEQYDWMAIGGNFS